MKKIARITRITAKDFFNKLREKSPILCKKLNKEVEISLLFLKHINWESKQREIREIVLRLITICSIEEILETWKISERRSSESFIYYKLEKEKNWEIFCLILSENKKNWIIKLLSSFIFDKGFYTNKKSSSQGLSLAEAH